MDDQKNGVTVGTVVLVVAVLVCLVPNTLSMNQMESTFGKTAVGTLADANPVPTLQVQRFQLAEAGNVSKLTVYVGGQSSPCNIIGVIYADNAGVPTTLVAKTPPTNVAGAAGWYDLVFSSPVSLTAGYYHLGWLSGASTILTTYYVAGGTHTWNTALQSSARFYPTPPNQFVVEKQNAYTFSIYATYTPTVTPPTQSAYEYRIRCNQTAQDDYGLTYPVTYVFSFTSNSTSLEVYKRCSLVDQWQRLPQYYAGEVFSGVETARFDYANKRVYVSVAFSSGSNDVYVKVAENGGNAVAITYLGTSSFYDNRKTTVIVTIDDVAYTDLPNGDQQKFLEMSRMFSDAQVWWTAGIITCWQNWQGYQDGINMGYCEVASHSVDHPDNVADYVARGYDMEIGDSKTHLTNNLQLAYSKNGVNYVWAYVLPSGYVDSMIESKAGQYKYLATRGVTWNTPTTWVSWNQNWKVYPNAGSGSFLDGDSLASLNNAFDAVHSQGGIYQVWGHVIPCTWTAGGKAYEHVQHLRGHSDVWYVGFGLMYLYHYTAETVAVNPN